MRRLYQPDIRHTMQHVARGCAQRVPYLHQFRSNGTSAPQKKLLRTRDSKGERGYCEILSLALRKGYPQAASQLLSSPQGEFRGAYFLLIR